MNRFRMIENVKRTINNLERKTPASFLLYGWWEKTRGHFLEVIPYLQKRDNGNTYDIMYYVVDASFKISGLRVQTYILEQRLSTAKPVKDEDISIGKISNRLYARVKYIAQRDGYKLLNTGGSDRVSLENIPILSKKDINPSQERGFDISFDIKEIEGGRKVSVTETDKPLLSLDIIDSEDFKGIKLGNGNLFVVKENSFTCEDISNIIIPNILSLPALEVYGKLINLHNDDSRLYLSESLIYNFYHEFFHEFLFGATSIPEDEDDEGFNLNPNEKPVENKRIPCAYTDGYNDGTPVGSLVNPDTGEEVKIVAGSTSIIRQENPELFREVLEKGPIKEGVSLRDNTEEKEGPFKVGPATNEEYPHSVNVGYYFRTEMSANLFEILVDEIAYLSIESRVKLLKYIKENNLEKEDN